MASRFNWIAVCAGAGLAVATWAAAPVPNAMLAEYFAQETARVAAGSLGEIRTLEDWTGQRAALREQLQEMLGLLPYPEKTDLKATITGRVEQPDFFVEKVHFQSMPGLYVTGNLYVPREVKGRVPAILYVCGHARVAEGKVSFGNKTNYQHHGIWFARHGYVCLIIDTIQLGELEGLHHGTYREGMWWWNARGYTPEGVEAWNCIRALDYLQARPEVDGEKIGMTGRSGGGAYTWFTAALDERVKVAVPVAGMTDLQNHVVDGCVAGHCDCMFMVNTHRWDYAKVAALLAPRPLLIANSDKDAIFPLDGVVRVHRDVARIYALHRASDKLGLLITEGPHKDTQDLQVPTFRWFNRFLKNDESLIRVPAEKRFKPAELRVFAELPTDQRTTKAHEFFVPAAAPGLPADAEAWAKQRDEWRRLLREKAFGGWPTADTAGPLDVRRVSTGAGGDVWEFTAHGNIRLPLAVVRTAGARPKRVVLRVVDAKDFAAARAEAQARADVKAGEAAVVVFPTRGLLSEGMNARDQVQVRRRYMLLGQTQDGMTVWDIGRAVAALRSAEMLGAAEVQLEGVGHQAVNAAYAALFAEGVGGVEMIAPPASHHTGPDYLNVLRFLDVPQAVAMVAERVPVRITRGNPDDWAWTSSALRRAGIPAERVQW